MSFYSEVVMPFFYDMAMDKPHIEEGRKNILKNVSGEVLEIGFGTGLNLLHYPPAVSKLTIIDKNPGMNKRAHGRISASKIKVDNMVLNGEEFLSKTNHLIRLLVHSLYAAYRISTKH